MRTTKKRENYEKGFTLIEAVVSTAVFAIAVASISGVYLSIQRINQQSAALQSLQQNGRFISEDITKIVRNGSIDYAAYPGGVIPQPSADYVRLRDVDGSSVHIFLQDGALMMTRGGNTAALTGNEVRVAVFRTYVWPATNPFPTGSQQPTLTVYMDIEAEVNRGQVSRIPFQITVATKEYPE